jgi:hypothetical protein
MAFLFIYINILVRVPFISLQLTCDEVDGLSFNLFYRLKYILTFLVIP